MRKSILSVHEGPASLAPSRASFDGAPLPSSASPRSHRVSIAFSDVTALMACKRGKPILLLLPLAALVFSQGCYAPRMARPPRMVHRQTVVQPVPWQLQVGMTQSQVRSGLGAPTVNMRQGIFATWRYDTTPGPHQPVRETVIHFKRGRVVSYVWDQPVQGHGRPVLRQPARRDHGEHHQTPPATQRRPRDNRRDADRDGHGHDRRGDDRDHDNRGTHGNGHGANSNQGHGGGQASHHDNSRGNQNAHRAVDKGRAGDVCQTKHDCKAGHKCVAGRDKVKRCQGKN